MNPPVDLDWSSLKLKVLGVFIGAGDLVEDNWRPRVDAVAKVLSSWHSRSLSFRGKALVINALPCLGFGMLLLLFTCHCGFCTSSVP